MSARTVRLIAACLATAWAAPALPLRAAPDPVGPSPTLGAKPPRGAKVLFSGKAEELRDLWNLAGTDRPAPWRLEGDAMVVQGGQIVSKETFTDFQLHLEFRCPDMPNATGQAKGNSGVYLQGRYEIQVLDSFGIADPGTGDCGALYGQAAPLVNACRPPLEWQTYDVFFRAARFDANGNLVSRARVTVLQNGIVVQNNVEINASGDAAAKAPGPLLLQDHGNPVAYRNIWVLPLPLQGANHY